MPLTAISICFATTWSFSSAVLASGFINAQRGLDDVTNKERDVLGKILESLFKSAKSDSADEKDQGVAKQMEIAVKGTSGY